MNESQVGNLNYGEDLAGLVSSYNIPAIVSKLLGELSKPRFANNNHFYLARIG